MAVRFETESQENRSVGTDGWAKYRRPGHAAFARRHKPMAPSPVAHSCFLVCSATNRSSKN